MTTANLEKTGHLPPPVSHGIAESSKPDDALPMTVIAPSSGWRWVRFREIWRYRELLLILIWRDIQVRYRQTILGAAWAVLPPLANMAVFSLFIGKFAGPLPNGLPYTLFVFAGFLPWFFVANSIASASLSVVSNQSLVTKVYFPRLVIPLASIGPHVLDFLIGFAFLLAMMLYYGVMPGWGIFLMPVMVVGLTITAAGVGTLLAALTVAYRDFRHIVPFLVQFGMFATPSIYLAADAIGSRSAAVLPINPAYGLIANFRAAMLGTGFDLYSFFVSAAVAAAALCFGCFYFSRVERSFADVI